MGFVKELGRRNVIRVAIAYLTLGWVVVQVTATVTPALNLPASALSLVTWIGLIGFPFVLLFSWVYELTPEGVKRESEIVRDESITHFTARKLDTIIIGLLVVALGLFGWHEFAGSPTPPASIASTSAPAASAAAPPASAAPAANSQKSIAVLPFENRSGEQNDAFFVDGIHDDILTQLAKIGALKVISRTSVERFRKTELDVKDIAKQLGVTKVLEGAVQRAGSRVRINVQLIDADTDAHMWAESYDRELTTDSLFAIQSEVASAIAGALQARLSNGEKANISAVPTQSLEAWESYQLGRQRMAHRTSAGLAEALTFFQRAIELDPKFALAHVGAADVQVLQTQYSSVPREQGLAAGEKSIERALALDADLGEAWATSGLIADQREQYEKADTMFKRAIELAPNYTQAHHWYSSTLSALGRQTDALQQAERAAELDPLSAIVNANLANFLASAGRFDDTEARWRKVLEIDPSMPNAYTGLAWLTATRRGRLVDAIPLLEQAIRLDPDNPWLPFQLNWMWLDIGEQAEVERIGAAMQARWPGSNPTLRQYMADHWTHGDLEALREPAAKLLAIDARDTFAISALRDADLAADKPQQAQATYLKARPELNDPQKMRLDTLELVQVGIDYAVVLGQVGDTQGARALLVRCQDWLHEKPRLGPTGYGIADVQIWAQLGEKDKALAALRAAQQAGWLTGWSYFRDIEPSLAPLRGESGFKAVFADIERDIDAQRAALRGARAQ